jgi:SAM-dependent methyltransferase
MSTVADHYAKHLGPVYAWMAGGVDAAIGRGALELEAIDMPAPGPGSDIAVDLGAGFGMHAIPLARRGHRVIAIDSCTALLDELRGRTEGLSVDVVDGDLLQFRRHVSDKAQAIFCMGDTLTHLDSRDAVVRLAADVAATLDRGGVFVTTFRDYSTALGGAQRFIPVRNDADRILTCFLEYSDDSVTVHDILHERAGSQWTMQVSSYRKLRLPPEWVVSCLESQGLSVQREPGMAGMIRLIARK